VDARLRLGLSSIALTILTLSPTRAATPSSMERSPSTAIKLMDMVEAPSERMSGWRWCDEYSESKIAAPVASPPFVFFYIEIVCFVHGILWTKKTESSFCYTNLSLDSL
jgi:hypothetical protein